MLLVTQNRLVQGIMLRRPGKCESCELVPLVQLFIWPTHSASVQTKNNPGIVLAL